MAVIHGFIARVTGSPATSIVVNRGSLDGVTDGARVVTYKNDTGDLTDPSPPGANLGRPQLITGIGGVVRLQEKMVVVLGTFGQMASPTVGDFAEITTT